MPLQDKKDSDLRSSSSIHECSGIERLGFVGGGRSFMLSRVGVGWHGEIIKKIELCQKQLPRCKTIG